MSTTDPATLQSNIDKLTETLKKARDEHKAEKAAMLGPIRKALALAEDANTDAILAALTARAPEAEALIAERTKTLTTERDDARTRLADVESRWAGERIDRSLSDALTRSGMIGDNSADALALARPLFALSDKGEVVTKTDAAGVVPGATPDQWIVSQLRTLRPHWWPKSMGGGAIGGSSRGSAFVGDTSCFRPGSSWNITAQAAFERKHGTRAAEAAARQYGATPFGLGR